MRIRSVLGLLEEYTSAMDKHPEAVDALADLESAGNDWLEQLEFVVPEGQKETLCVATEELEEVAY